MWWMWATALGASPQAALMDALSQVDAGPRLAVSCAPMSEVHAVIGDIPLPPSMLWTPSGQAWLQFAGPQGLSTLGIDPGGQGTLLVYDGGASLISVDVSEGVDAPTAFVDRLVGGEPGPPAVWEDGQLTTYRGAPVAEAGLRATLHEGRLTAGLNLPAEGRDDAMARLVALSPDFDDGCLVAIDFVDEAEEEDEVALGRVVALMQIGMGEAGGGLRVRLQSDLPVPKALSQPPQPLRGGHSSVPPDVVVGLGLPLQDLLLDPVFLAAADLSYGEVASFLQFVSFDAGTTVGLFGSLDEPQFVLDLGVRDAGGRPMASKYLRKILKGALSNGSGVRRVGRSAMQGSFGPNQPAFAIYEDGRTVIGSVPQVVVETAQGRGDGWVDDRLDALAETYPVVVAAHRPLDLGPLREVVGYVGLRTFQGYWDAELVVGLPGMSRADRRALSRSTLGGIVSGLLLSERDGDD